MSKSAFYRQIAHQEVLHEKQALKFSKDALEQYETAYSLCDEILYDIEENVDMTDDLDRKAIYMILVRIMGTMQSIKWLLLKGHYYDAAVLGRSFMESLGTCCHIFQNKSTGEKWFKEEKLCTSLDKFKAIAKTLGQEISEEDTTDFYRNLCKFVHGNRLAIDTFISAVEDEYNPEDKLWTIRFSNPSPYDKRMVDNIANHPVVTLLVIQELFPEISDYDKRQIAEIQSKQYKTFEVENH